MTSPTLDLERELLEQHGSIIGIDEVGRGALAGPVAVGAFFFTSEQLAGMPDGLKDSKLISEPKRAPVADLVGKWGQHAIGMASVGEIEDQGITRALALAASRALERLPSAGLLLLDGSHNWLGSDFGPVRVQTKADRDCGSVAAASVVSKVERDGLMVGLDQHFPQFGFAKNKGYSSPGHIAALREHGPIDEHRRSWLGKILAAEQSLF